MTAAASLGTTTWWPIQLRDTVAEMHDHSEDFSYGHPIFGTEFDWLAVDSASQVGVFCTAGYGPVPDAVMRRSADLDDAFERKLPNLPVIGGFVADDIQGNLAFWEHYSEQGLFGYDWEHWDGPYFRVTVPTMAITVDVLPEALQELAILVRLPVAFNTTTTVNLESVGIRIAPKPS